MSLPRAAVRLLADIATIRGRASEAGELIALAESPEAETAARPPAAAVRDILEQLRTRPLDTVIGEALDHVPPDVRRLVVSGTLTVSEAAHLVQQHGSVTAGDLRVLLAQEPVH